MEKSGKVFFFHIFQNMLFNLLMYLVDTSNIFSFNIKSWYKNNSFVGSNLLSNYATEWRETEMFHI